MKILLTGASGFLGSIMCPYFRLEGYSVTTLGRAKEDLKYDFSSGDSIVLSDSYDLVIHCAGKAHSVPVTQIEKMAFFDINVKGTQYLLDGLETAPTLPKSFVFISTIAVYGKETGSLIDEESPLLAKDPYGLSKIQAEKIVQEWCEKHSVICSILRLPLIAGPNPPGNLKAMINGVLKGFYFDIAGGKATKSMVLAEDVAKIIPKAASIGGTYNLTDMLHPCFADLSHSISLQLGKGKVRNLPLWIATLMAKVGDLLGKSAPINSDKLSKITSDLTFDDSRARKVLAWKPRSVLEHFKIK
ncbi:NAD-dependent epimerase/dehydratase family protein [Pedobacter sp. PWIIR3]